VVREFDPTRALPTVACTVLQTLNQTGDLVFPNKIGEVMVGYRKSWLKIVKLVILPDDIAPHMLRHIRSYPLAVISPSGHSTTSRYVHTADAVLLAAADAVANATWKLVGQLNLNLESDQPQPRCRRINIDMDRVGRIHLFIGIFMTPGIANKRQSWASITIFGAAGPSSR
jgi:hypothetical protein